jgi:hypothetical protein
VHQVGHYPESDDDDNGDDGVITGRGGRVVSSHNLDGPGFKAGYRLSWQGFVVFFSYSGQNRCGSSSEEGPLRNTLSDLLFVTNSIEQSPF